MGLPFFRFPAFARLLYSWWYPLIQLVTRGHTNFFFDLFLYLRSAHRVCNLQFIRCCASPIFTYFSFMSSYSIAPPQFRSSYISVFAHFRLPCSHYYNLLQCFSPHGLTISVPLILRSHMFATHALTSSFLIFSFIFFSHHPYQYSHFSPF